MPSIWQFSGNQSHKFYPRQQLFYFHLMHFNKTVCLIFKTQIRQRYLLFNKQDVQILMKILGISAFYHDSAAAVINGDKIIAAAQEERFTRKKHDPRFPVNATQFCLEQAGYTIDELDAIVFYDKPLLKFERLLETYYSFAPKGIRSFITAIPVWLKEKMFLKRLIHEELAKVGAYDKKLSLIHI